MLCPHIYLANPTTSARLATLEDHGPRRTRSAIAGATLRRRRARGCVSGVVALAKRCGLPALPTPGSVPADTPAGIQKPGPQGRLEMQVLPPAVHCSRRNIFRGQSHSAFQMGDGRLHPVRQPERNRLETTGENAGPLLQDRLVHVSSSSPSHGGAAVSQSLVENGRCRRKEAVQTRTPLTEQGARRTGGTRRRRTPAPAIQGKHCRRSHIKSWRERHGRGAS